MSARCFRPLGDLGQARDSASPKGMCRVCHKGNAVGRCDRCGLRLCLTCYDRHDFVHKGDDF